MNFCSKIIILDLLAQKHCLKHMQTLRKLLAILKATKRKQEYNSRRGGRKFNRPKKSNFGPNHDKEKKTKKVTNESIAIVVA